MLIELLAVAALNQGSTATPPAVMINPPWAATPTPSWPRGAKQMNIVRADVVTNCVAGPEGRVADCRIESESPSGYGFAREVLASTSAARLDTSAENYVEGAAVQFTVRFSHHNIQIPSHLDDD